MVVCIQKNILNYYDNDLSIAFLGAEQNGKVFYFFL